MGRRIYERLQPDAHVRAEPGGRIRADIYANVSHHLESGLPGGTTTVLLLYLALNWLIVERLTLPGIFTEEEIHGLVASAVDRLLA